MLLSYRIMSSSPLRACFLLTVTSLTYVWAFECDRHSVHCFTSLDIDYAYTMFSKDHGHVITNNRNIYLAEDPTFQLPLSTPIITGDGYINTTRTVIVANGTLPGPKIVMYQNQKITIIVNNNLMNELVTIHWHGLDQHNTPFMDGVPFVTQCPIAPGQSFNYTFQPRYGGTYWYHSHVGSQRDFGLYGAFIVLRNDEAPNDLGNVLVFAEWNHLLDSSWTAEIVDSLAQSVLVNGKGEFENNEAPLEVISGGSGNRIKFVVFGPLLAMNQNKVNGC